MLAVIDKATPVLFVDTRMLFTETLVYQAEVSERLGLQNLHIVSAADILQMSGFGGCLATERAQAGGRYSAVPQSNIIGPEGGRMLVDKTVEIVNELWK